MSREFFDLVKGIGESRSKQEEDRIISQEVQRLKQNLQDPASQGRIKEYLVRALYAEMLGHDASFAHIHAVKLVSDKNILSKRTGYMMCALCLNPTHEFLLLLVNTIQKDLASSDYLEVAVALTSCAQVMQAEAVPIMLPFIVNLLSHCKELIRKKALSALLALYRLDPSILSTVAPEIRRVLHDSDLGVISAALDLIGEIVKRRHVDELAQCFYAEFDGLIPSLVSILKDVLSHKLPREWDFHRVPAPWLQIKILNLMVAVVGTDQKNSEEVYEILRTVMSKCDLQVNISYAITFECVRTIASIYPQQSLCEMAAMSTARLIEADNKNLKLAGIIGLRALIQLDQAYIAPHQLSIIDCLDDKDETLRTKTLELLALTTSSSNVVAVVEKLLSSANSYVDTMSKEEIIHRAIELIERFAPSHEWYLGITTKLFSNFSHFVPLEAAYDLVRLVGAGPTGDDVLDTEFRKEAVRKMMTVAEKLATVKADSAIRAIFWILGSFANLIPDEYTVEEILDLFTEALLSKRSYQYKDTRCWILTSLLKYAAHMIDQDVMQNPELSHGEKKSILRGENSKVLGWISELKQLLQSTELYRISGFDFSQTHNLREFLKGLEDGMVIKDLYPRNPYIEDLRDENYGVILSGFIKATGLGKKQEKLSKISTPAVVKLLPPRKDVALKFKPYLETQASFEETVTPPTTAGGPIDETKVVDFSSHTEEFRITTRGGRWNMQGVTQLRPSHVAPTEKPQASLAQPKEMAPKETKRQPFRAEVDGELEQKRRIADELFAGVSNKTTKSNNFTRKLPLHTESSSSAVDVRSGKRSNLLEMSDDDSSKVSQSLSASGASSSFELLVIPVDELSRSWPSAATEVKTSHRLASDLAVGKLVEILQSLNFYSVEVIGNEGLCTAKAPHSTTRFFLYHKIENQVLHLTLRTDQSEGVAKNTLQDIEQFIGFRVPKPKKT
eukprot:Gregarina_sp_Poly_1__4569@NODE_244_length_10763_cov_79_258975_g214_i0_p2_GENE_NODE_244_length_10763_cov_79_258975_g214_i0NODE_244_length_10763_cov_79_258975_g214_i0_p2_ORF_typecomplete_len993_score143_10Adaptin_N/PF01602_20/8e99AP4E_app_platf/PF14807_6/8_3e10Cnd1/PF12717_7/0_0022Cnd1/PF12717_7/0_026Proteasom_PSMB/PF10508_9/0_00024Proteasom_PSMB/PF10508_9/2_3HEAT_2/PF13646_6/1_2e04HEAT_2/PF13646_6/0_12HEAT_2/PF13646_6/7_7HEAT_2/PF13646_6/1_2e04Arm_2/PF04826_13/4_2Arm_2/PF04826_13/0_33CLASP_N/PF12